ncbi:MAG: hypothetical protein ACJATA_001090 [Sphingobacteriales bacterium]|jgi:hypothetical protein
MSPPKWCTSPLHCLTNTITTRRIMKRREFIKNSAAIAAGSIFAPYILPSGRLFAKTPSPMAGHVVYVLFGGGVRQQEATLQRYLADSQGIDIEGNIMYNMLTGAPPEAKIAYGTNLPGQTTGSEPIPQILSKTIQEQGILFPELRFSKSGTGHFTGLNTLVTGNYGVNQGLKQRPIYPSIFEYARKHLDIPATKTWFVGNTIGNSVPLLNYSNHPDYGERYGGNFIEPNITFGNYGNKYLANSKVFHPEEQLAPIEEMRLFLNNSYSTVASGVSGVKNTFEERQDIKNFLKVTLEKTKQGQISFPPGAGGGDLRTVGYACEVMKWFKPTVTVVNMSSVDACHGNYTGYLKSLHRADHAVGHLWNYIQTQIPEMAGNTAIVVTPEHGRNYEPNPILDENNWASFDHDSDANSRRVFGMIAGPGMPTNLSVGTESNPVGDSSDCVPTIAEFLGIKSEVMGAGLLDANAKSWFDRI